MNADKKLSDKDILEKSIENPKYFELLVSRYQGPFLRKSASIIRDKEDAEDIVQETFLKIYKNGKKFKALEGASFRSWAYEILRNTCYSHYKKQKIRDLYTRSVEWLSNIEDPSIPSLSKEAESMDNKSYIESVLAIMPEKLANVMRLYFLEEKSQKEIAELENISAGAVRTRMHRAKSFFRKISMRAV